jgi:O-methyltransferase
MLSNLRRKGAVAPPRLLIIGILVIGLFYVIQRENEKKNAGPIISTLNVLPKAEEEDEDVVVVSKKEEAACKAITGCCDSVPCPFSACSVAFPETSKFAGATWQEVDTLIASYTMVTVVGRKANYAAVGYITRNSIPGDLLETGVARGGSSAGLALYAMALGQPRRIHLYDTFAGMPPADLDNDGPASLKWTGMIKHGVDEVKGNLHGLGIPLGLQTYHAGDVMKAPKEEVPCQLALIRIDTDWYASHTWALEVLYPKLVPGGIIMFDDYGFWQGSAKAIHEWLDVYNKNKPTESHIKLTKFGFSAGFCKPGGPPKVSCPFQGDVWNENMIY